MLIRLTGGTYGYVNPRFVSAITFSYTGEPHCFHVYIWTYGDASPFVEKHPDKETARKRVEELRKIIEKCES